MAENPSDEVKSPFTVEAARERKDAWGARCPQVTFTLGGRWWRIFAGVTFRPDKPRWMDSRFHGYRLWRLRLWKIGPHDARVVGIQTRLARLCTAVSGPSTEETT